MRQYLKATKILDFESDSIQKLVHERGWKALNNAQKIEEIYNYVRDQVLFGYNEDDALCASRVLQDGYGQCNTKASLFMALLRAVGVPNRMRGFTIDKALQKGAISGIWYRLSPNNILHSWVEVYLDNKWYKLEGIILDKAYLSALQRKFADCKTTFCGYGVYTGNFANPPVDWDFGDTFIQHKGINQDFGLFDTPDDFYRQHRQNLSLLKRWAFKNWVRHLMNRNVANIRKIAH